eukprot:6961474-Lingulodinium_polyedra.AAC.1
MRSGNEAATRRTSCREWPGCSPAASAARALRRAAHGGRSAGVCHCSPWRPSGHHRPRRRATLASTAARGSVTGPSAV